MNGQDFTTEQLLKASGVRGGRGIENSGVKVPLPKWETKTTLHDNYYKDGVVTQLPGGGKKETAPLSGGGTYTETHKPKPNNRVGTDDTYSASTPDGGKVTVHGEFPNQNGHGNFTADIKKPDGSSEKVQQRQTGMSGSSHGVHTRRDAKGNLTSRFQVDNIRDWNEMNPGTETFTHHSVHGYHAPTPDSGGDVTGGSPAASGRYSVSPNRNSATSGGRAAPAPTGGEVGGKDDHAFHGNQFTAHGTDVPVKGPQPKKKSLDFTTEALLKGQGIYGQPTSR